MENANPKELMEAKSREKKEKIALLRSANKDLSDLQAQLEQEMPKDTATRSQNPSRLQERIDKMEFYIATSAYTPAQEREMLRNVQAERAELKKALADDKTWAGVRAIRSKLREKRQQRKDIRKELDGLSAELDRLYKSIIEQGTKDVAQRKDAQKKRFEARERGARHEDDRRRRDAERQELAPYMKEMDSFVSLEDIAEVKKKKKEE
jgi:uncharacterized coiled-coil DUF342 family protein